MSDMVKCVSKRPKEVFFFFRIDLGAMLVGQFHIVSHSKLYSFFGFVFLKQFSLMWEEKTDILAIE